MGGSRWCRAGRVSVQARERGDGPSVSTKISECRLELIKTVVELRLGDNDRRCQADGGAVGVLGQHASSSQRLAQVTTGAQLWLDVHPGPESSRTYGDDTVTDQPLESCPKLKSKTGGAI